MDLNTTIDIIIKDLNEASQIIDDLKLIPGVPALQVELAKSKCKTASDVIALLKSLPEAGVVVKPVSAPIEVPKSERKAEIPEIKPPVKSAEEPVASEKTRKTTDETTLSKASPVVKKEPKPAAKKTGEQSIIADQFSNMPESFNETLGNLKHEDDVLEILKTKRVTSLAEAIGVNDKFLFIREIFDGNQENYNQAILKLETVANLNEAWSIIMSYTGNNTENEAIHQLLDLIKRKFPSHE
jgi:hypothetical protein